tara:strand:+ start:2213 stop:2878 length:666 start_codon:yes stop_codon:yes gene_type:complete
MRKDQIIVLLLVVLLPLTGCIGGESDAGEESNTEESGSTSSEENQSQDSTTIINHYHYNNTTIIYQSNNSTDDGASSSGSFYNNSTYVDNYFTNNTYVDNYYTNHSNSTNYSQVTTVIYSQGGYWNGGSSEVWNLSTLEGEMVQIVEAHAFSWAHGTRYNLNIITDCSGINIIEFSTMISGEEGLLPHNLPGSSMNCTHTWDLSGTASWSIVYSIQNTTVI